METPPLACPQCGGAVRPEEDSPFTACEFCGSQLYLDPGLAVRHYVLASALPRRELPLRLGRWLQGREALGRPRNVSVRMLHFPFWALESEGGVRARAAAPLLPSGAARFELPAGDLKSFRRELVADSEVIPASILLETVWRVQTETSPREDAPKRALPWLVHVPFWEVRFRIAARDHRVWIDAAQGQVVTFALPVSSEKRRDQLYASILGTTYAMLLSGFLLVFSGGTHALPGLLILATAGPAGWWLTRLAISRSESA